MDLLDDYCSLVHIVDILVLVEIVSVLIPVVVGVDDLEILVEVVYVLLDIGVLDKRRLVGVGVRVLLRGLLGCLGPGPSLLLGGPRTAADDQLLLHQIDVIEVLLFLVDVVTLLLELDGFHFVEMFELFLLKLDLLFLFLPLFVFLATLNHPVVELFHLIQGALSHLVLHLLYLMLVSK